jgi:hypothetical protein
LALRSYDKGIDGFIIENYYLAKNHAWDSVLILALISVWGFFFRTMQKAQPVASLSQPGSLYDKLMKKLPSKEERKQATVLLCCGLLLLGLFVLKIDLDARNPFSILQVEPTTDFQGIKRAYRKSALSYHSD